MWAQGNQWNQMPLDAAAYQNMNHELVDWASLAQQWIRMKEVHETVVLNVPQVNQNPFNINVNPLLSQPFVGLHPADSIVTSGEAPMDVEKDDEAVTNQPDWNWQNQTSVQPNISWTAPLRPQMPVIFPQGVNTGNPIQLPVSATNQIFHAGTIPVNFPPRVPLLPLPAAHPNSSDEDSLGASSLSTPILDASKRKNLPAWIREGLEKMEREKQKKEEREKFLLERELKRRECGVSDDTVAPGRSRFDDSEESESDDNDEERRAGDSQNSVPPNVVQSGSLEDIMVKIRQLMTEILLEVTTEEIKSAALEAVQQPKVKTRQAQSPLSSKSLTQKLGLDQYGSDSDEVDSESEDRSRLDLRDAGTEIQDKFHGEQMSGVQKNTIFNTDGLSVQSNSTSKSELHKQSKDESNGLLKDGTKVDTDITYKLSHGKDEIGDVHSGKKEDVKGTEKNLSMNSSKLKLKDKRSRSPEKRERSRSKDRRHVDKRYNRRSDSRRRSRSRERNRSNSRRRSRSRGRKRSSSRRRSRSYERRDSRKRTERDKSRDKRKK